MRHFATAFARALPEGSHRDPLWSELPLGVVGQAIVKVEIDAEGHIDSVKLDPEIPTVEVIRRMIDRAILLLEAGTFSLDAKSVSPGVERFSLQVALSQTGTTPDEGADPRHLFSESHQAPRPDHPGHSRFVLNSGRQMDAVIRLLDSE